MNKSVIDALKDAEFTEEDIDLLGGAEADKGPVQNWPESAFKDVLPGPTAVAAAVVVRATKVGAAPEIAERSALPAKPPYLDVDKNGVPVGYDPHDPAQFWTDPRTGETWRWDGKREDGRGGKASSITKEQSPRQQYPYGQPHRVVQVKHITVRGVMLPDPQEAHDASMSGADWFHRGYNVWIGGGNKPYADVDPETRMRVKNAQESAGRTGNPLIRRAPALV